MTFHWSMLSFFMRLMHCLMWLENQQCCYVYAMMLAIVKVAKDA